MKTYKSEMKPVESQEVASIACNFCGKEVHDKQVDYCDITSFTISPGYGSSFDGDTFSFDICDMCINEISAVCVITPDREENF